MTVRSPRQESPISLLRLLILWLLPLHLAQILMMRPSLPSLIMVDFPLVRLKLQNLPRVPWSDLIWFKGRINKFSSLVWMAINEGLKTKKSLATRFHITDVSCLLCNSSTEDCKHIFIQCSFSWKVWTNLAAKWGAQSQDVTR